MLVRGEKNIIDRQWRREVERMRSRDRYACRCHQKEQTDGDESGCRPREPRQRMERGFFMATMDDIISIEWKMFQAVNEGRSKASCQNDHVTFDRMRRAQFEAWSAEALGSYLRDLETAKSAGHNLVEEKYIRMMERTAPEEYVLLQGRLPALTLTRWQLAEEIAEKMLRQTEEWFARFPDAAEAFRPLHSEQDTLWSTSLETYQLGELLTYSENTLIVLREHILALEAQGISLAKSILENSI